MALLETNLAAFNAQMEAAVARLEAHHVPNFTKKVAMEALRKIVMKNPVAEVNGGRSRGNWQVTTGGPAHGEIAASTAVNRDATTEGTYAIDAAGSGEVIWITNNVPYILRLEDGYSGQAPRGMIEPTIEELSTMFEGPGGVW